MKRLCELLKYTSSGRFLGKLPSSNEALWRLSLFRSVWHQFCQVVTVGSCDAPHICGFTLRGTENRQEWFDTLTGLSGSHSGSIHWLASQGVTVVRYTDWSLKESQWFDTLTGLSSSHSGSIHWLASRGVTLGEVTCYAACNRIEESCDWVFNIFNSLLLHWNQNLSRHNLAIKDDYCDHTVNHVTSGFTQTWR